MSRLARLSLANRALVALFSVLILGFGLLLVPSLRQQLLPSLEIPTVSIATPVPGGAGPEIVEQRLTVPIEDAIAGVDGITTVSSTSSDGLSVVQAQFDYGTDLDQALRDLRTAVDTVRAQLPEGSEPDVSGGGTDDLPALTIAAYQPDGKTDLRALAGTLSQSVLPELKKIDGVRETTMTGTLQDQIVISPNPSKLASAGIEPAAIGKALQERGTSAAAGTVDQNGMAVPVQTGNPLTSVASIGDVALPGSSGPVLLKSVAKIKQQPVASGSLNRTNGIPSLAVGVTVAQDASAVKVSNEIRDRLDELQRASRATLVITFDQAPFVQRSIKSLATEGLLGLLMAVLIILLFLRSVRSTVVTALSIPLSLVFALIALKFFDYSLNLLTLGALTVAVGRVVDDSIVVLENIKRHIAYGGDKAQAVLTGVREVAGAVAASTATTVAVFLPIAFVSGLVGELFAPFAVTVTVALLASLLVALTVIPVLAYWFLKPPPPGSDPEATQRAAEERESKGLLQKAYLPVIHLATKHRLITVGAGLGLLLFALGQASNVKTNFLDQDGQDTVTISQELPPGSGLDTVDAAVQKVEGVLAKRTDLQSYDMTAGGNLGATKAQFSLSLKDGTDAKEVVDQLTKTFEKRPELGELALAAGQSADGGNSKLSVVVKAADRKALAAATEAVRKAMTETPDVADVRSTLAGDTQRIDVAVDQEKAIRAGVTAQSVDAAVAAAFRGTPLGQVTVDGAPLPVVLKAGNPPGSVAQVSGLTVQGKCGPVTVGSVAAVSIRESQAQIDRVDQQRAATVTGKATGSDVGAAAKSLTSKLEALTLPDGAEYEIGGVSADQSDAFTSLGLAVFAAIALVFLVMVATFRSLLQPLILLVSIPFAAVGAIGALLVTNTALGVPAMIGLLMLVGIVVTNAIVLIDLVNHYRATGVPVQHAVIEGGRRRLRPILMTALATIFALIPMGLGLTGEGGFISRPLAVVVIGGLVSSTLLTLVLVPALYVQVESGRERRAEKKQRKREAALAAASEARMLVETGDAPARRSPRHRRRRWQAPHRGHGASGESPASA
jgi:HAE1 family hydrophobic/amphiphilic exporter-1